MRSDIREGIQNAFIENYGDLEAAVYAARPDATFKDVEAVMLELAAELFQNNRPLLYKAISGALYQAPEDCSKGVDDHAQDVFVHLLQKPEKLKGLLFPKRAKSTTVLFSLVKSRMRGVRSLLSDRRALVLRRAVDIVCETALPDPTDNEEKILAWRN
jgi:hypothetical protein